MMVTLIVFLLFVTGCIGSAIAGGAWIWSIWMAEVDRIEAEQQ